MTEPRLLQNFSGGRAIVVTDRASSLDALMTALNRLGVGTDAADIVEVGGDDRCRDASARPRHHFHRRRHPGPDGASAQPDRPASSGAR